jgi:GTPase SAR1 family protein
MAVFDITQRETFDSVEANIKEYRMYCPWEFRNNVVLIGNKVDLSDKRQVSEEEAKDFVKRFELLDYFETSASSA